MRRTALGLMFAMSAGCLADVSSFPFAWLFAAAGVVSPVWRRRDAGRATGAAARKVLHLAVGGTMLLSWLVLVYPVMGAETLRLWSLLIGGTFGVTGAFLLLTESEERAWGSSVLAAVGMLVVSSFDIEARVEPYIWAFGACAVAYLAVDVVAPSGRVGVRRLVRVGAFVSSSAVVGTLIVLVLPWTQGKVEETMVTLYAPPGEGMDSRSHARLGELRRLKLSKRVVMRVWSERPQRLRTHVLERFDGRGWSSGLGGVLELSPVERSELDSEARRFLDAIPGRDFEAVSGGVTRERWIRTRVVRSDGGGLATPGGSGLLHAPLEQVRLGAAGEWLQPPEARARVYGVLHEVDHQRAQHGPLDESRREIYLQLPDSLDPRIPMLARGITEGAPTTEAAVDAVVRYLRSEYSYSLEVEHVGTSDPLADFLFEEKRGWCEFFAGAAAVLLRAQGIPTRYVRGFNVIGSQRKGDHYVVRDWDRHAWVEAYIEGKGWLEYDPTPAAEYESLHAGLGDGVLSRAVEWARMQFASIYARMWHVEWASVIRALAWIGLAAAALYALARARSLWQTRLWRRPRENGGEMTEADRVLATLDTRLAALGRARPSARGPLEHWTALETEGSARELPLGGRAIIEAVYGARYGGRSVSAEEWHRLLELLARSRGKR